MPPFIGSIFSSPSACERPDGTIFTVSSKRLRSSEVLFTGLTVCSWETSEILFARSEGLTLSYRRCQQQTFLKVEPQRSLRVVLHSEASAATPSPQLSVCSHLFCQCAPFSTGVVVNLAWMILSAVRLGFPSHFGDCCRASFQWDVGLRSSFFSMLVSLYRALQG